MAIQTLNLNPPPVLVNANGTNNIGNLNTGANFDKEKLGNLQDQLLGGAGYKPNNAPSVNETETRINSQDKISLSAEAQAAIDNRTNSQNDNLTSLVQGSLDNQSLDFRGLSQIATSRTLTDDEVSKVNDIRQNFADAGITNDKDILKIAEKNLADLQTQSSSLVQLFQTGDITGGQFKQLNDINTALNKANGFGADQSDNSAQAQASNLTKQIKSITDQNPDQRLSSTSLNNLGTLQQQVSSLNGYRLSVNDSVGPDGLLV